MKIFYPKWKKRFLVKLAKRKLMIYTTFGIKWSKKIIRTEKIFSWKIIYLMTPKMIFYIRRQSEKINVPMAELWMSFVICLRKPEEYLASCMVQEFFIVEALTSSRS